MIKIGFTGDFCPWERMESLYHNEKWKESLIEIKPYFDKNDLNVIDLECPLTRHNEGITKTGPLIKSAPETVSILKWLNCKLVATANNHFKDYGNEGMQETFEVLSNNSIEWVGSGRNLSEAARTKIIQINEFNIAIINMAENEWSTTTGDQYGCHSLDAIDASKHINNAMIDADYVIMVIHGGHEHYNLPSPRMKKLYRFFVDMGADAVIGHHTHIFSGYEIYEGKPIFYSLGNFCFDWKGFQNSPWNTGLILRLILKGNSSIDFEYQFIEQNNSAPGVRPIEGNREEKLQHEIENLNRIIQHDDQLKNRFNEHVSKLKKTTMARLQPYKNRILTGLYTRGLFPDLLAEKKKLLLTNLIRCESHREVLLEILKDLNK